MATQIYRLVMRSGPTPQRVLDLTQPVISIGRDYSNDFVINDVEISRKHARLTAQGGSYIIEDMGSTNGTFVNGQRLMGPHMMRPGEVIAFGESVRLVFEAYQFDPNATVVAPIDSPPYQPVQASYPGIGAEPIKPAGEAQPAYPQASYEPAPVYTPPAAAQYQQPPMYSGQIPESPLEMMDEEEPRKTSRTWILLGLGCLVVFLCVCLGVAIAFDTLNLYCIPPFSSTFNWLYTCP